MKKTFIICIACIIVLALFFFTIKSEYIFNIINMVSLSTGFISFVLSVYIINYTDDIKAELKIKRNKEKTEEYLKKEFCKEYQSNKDVIDKFYVAFSSKQIEQILLNKDEVFTILVKYKSILDDFSLDTVDLNKYINSLNTRNFITQITKGRNNDSFKTSTIRIQTIFSTLFEELKD